MSLPVTFVNYRRTQFHFRDFFLGPFSCTQKVPEDSPSSYVKLGTIDPITQQESSLYVDRHSLDKHGIHSKVFSDISSSAPERLPELLRCAERIFTLLRNAQAVVGSEASHYFFGCRIYSASSIILDALYTGKEHRSFRGMDFPGMYFDRVNEQIQGIFINLKHTPRVGFGGFCNIKNVLLLNASLMQPKIVVKRVLQNIAGKVRFLRGLNALQLFQGTRGIVHLLGGGFYKDPDAPDGGKYAMFLPKYDCDLVEYREQSTFSLSGEEKLDLIDCWLDGLASIAKRGIHGDIKPDNLLIRKGPGGVGGAITDFDVFCEHGSTEKLTGTTRYHPPEFYHDIAETSKRDVWAMGLTLHAMVAKKQIPIPETTQKGHAMWTTELSPGWIEKYPMRQDTPAFLQSLICDMLHPNPDLRPSPEEVLKRFREGRNEENPLKRCRNSS
jgi:hypothetical protein